MATDYETTYKYLSDQAETHDVSLNESNEDFRGDVEYMASRWTGEGRPPCNCKGGQFCPCGFNGKQMKTEVERDGVCYCLIFAKKAV